MQGATQVQQTTPDAGLDIESQIRDGVAAFMQSQDPAIAVEVVTMIASMMGLAPNVQPYTNQAPTATVAPTPPVGAPSLPMGQNGMRMYKRGGKIAARGTKFDPPGKGTNRSTDETPELKKNDKILPKDKYPDGVKQWEGYELVEVDLGATNNRNAYIPGQGKKVPGKPIVRKDFDSYQNSVEDGIPDLTSEFNLNKDGYSDVHQSADSEFHKNPNLEFVPTEKNHLSKKQADDIAPKGYAWRKTIPVNVEAPDLIKPVIAKANPTTDTPELISTAENSYATYNKPGSTKYKADQALIKRTARKRR